MAFVGPSVCLFVCHRQKQPVWQFLAQKVKGQGLRLDTEWERVQTDGRVSCRQSLRFIRV